MKKSQIITEIFNNLHSLKTAKNHTIDKDDMIRNKIVKLEMVAESILMNQFEEIENEKIDEYLSNIKNNADKAKEEVKKVIENQEKTLRVASYIDDTIEYIKKIKEII